MTHCTSACFVDRLFIRPRRLSPPADYITAPKGSGYSWAGSLGELRLVDEPSACFRLRGPTGRSAADCPILSLLSPSRSPLRVTLWGERLSGVSSNPPSFSITPQSVMPQRTYGFRRRRAYCYRAALYPHFCIFQCRADYITVHWGRRVLVGGLFGSFA